MTRRYHVHGLVQGVGFRYFVLRRARGLGLSGYVRNMAGAVEVVASGPVERLDQLEAALRTGPPMAHVTNVEMSENMAEASAETEFTIRG